MKNIRTLAYLRQIQKDIRVLSTGGHFETCDATDYKTMLAMTRNDYRRPAEKISLCCPLPIKHKNIALGYIYTRY